MIYFHQHFGSAYVPALLFSDDLTDVSIICAKSKSSLSSLVSGFCSTSFSSSSLLKSTTSILFFAFCNSCSIVMINLCNYLFIVFSICAAFVEFVRLADLFCLIFFCSLFFLSSMYFTATLARAYIAFYIFFLSFFCPIIHFITTKYCFYIIFLSDYLKPWILRRQISGFPLLLT